jgi:hypothetical protein
MSRSFVAGALLFMSAVVVSGQNAPQKPGPMDNLVKTPNPMNSPDQIDAEDLRQWRLAMRKKYEGKFPGPAPRTPEGKPDLNGVWMTGVTTPERPAMTHLALTQLEDRYKTNMKDFPYAFCLPRQPVPGGGLWVVMQNGTQLVTLFEYPPNYRLVFLDGRPHPPDLEPAWMGHSIGTWEGDTLIVDSIGFNDTSWLESFLPHTANMRIRERWTRTTMGTMTVELMYEDPEMFVKPWKVVQTMFLAPGENLMENICENNKFPQLTAGQNP